MQHMTGAVDTLMRRMDSQAGPLLPVRPEPVYPASGRLDRDAENPLESTVGSTFNPMAVLSHAPVRPAGANIAQPITADSAQAGAARGHPLAPSRGNILGLSMGGGQSCSQGGNTAPMGDNPR